MVVIADDITGAAEIAGIAFEAGQQVRLLCAGISAATSVGGDSVATTPTAATIVIATDTRSMTEGEAVDETHRIVSSLLTPTAHSELSTPLIYKKTDSALRGHVIAELSALKEAMGYKRVVYCPANPSKGRIIKGGNYYIGKVPIDRTDFSFDPEFPATTSALKKRFPEAPSEGIIMPDAESMDDLFCIIRLYDDGRTLFAGAADLFRTLLDYSRVAIANEATRESGKTDTSDSGKTLFPDNGKSVTTSEGKYLILCGSTQSKPLDIGIPVAPMPLDIYNGGNDLTTWNTAAYGEQHSLILTIPYTHRTGKEVATHLRSVMARKARQLVSEQRPDHLIIEGGATAWGTLHALGWTEFEIVGQVAPGVVQMRSVTSGVLVTLKPGSYPWGGLFEQIVE